MECWCACYADSARAGLPAPLPCADSARASLPSLKIVGASPFHQRLLRHMGATAQARTHTCGLVEPAVHGTGRPAEAWRVFDASRVSEAAFAEAGPVVLASPDLVRCRRPEPAVSGVL